MKKLACLLIALPLSLPVVAQTMSMPMGSPAVGTPGASEQLGKVSFPVSCAAAEQVPFNRGVALLHDFWYEEARHQFTQIAEADPGCSMAYWGEAMASFHQIWDRPDAATSATAWAEMQKAQTPGPKTARERAYISALSAFFQPGAATYQARIDAYAQAMGKLYRDDPDDVDAGAFYALSLLASQAPGDSSLSHNREAMAVLTPLFARYPDHPGVIHYIIHACDNPTLAADGLKASDRYGVVSPAGAHAVHMPGHIYARLGLWPQDITANLGSITAAEEAEAHHESSVMDEPHAYDFLLYAYLQSAQDANAKGVMEKMTPLLTRLDAMPEMKGHRDGMVAYYRTEIPAFYYLEMRDWKTAETLKPQSGAAPENAMLAYWARTVAAGRLRHADEARASLAEFDALVEEVKKGRHAYYVEGNGVKITRGEMLAWTAVAEGKQEEALKQMRAAADLQDKVGQGEVDIPAREMLADMMLEFHQPEKALAEYQQSNKLSPNRFNGLFHAGLAAEAAGRKTEAQQYYTTLLKITHDGEQSSRPEFAHVKSFMASTQVAAR